jgi:hypothetical protein
VACVSTDQQQRERWSRARHVLAAPGMNGDLKIFPQSGYVIAVLANMDPPAAGRVSDFIAQRLPVKASASLSGIEGPWQGKMDSWSLGILERIGGCTDSLRSREKIGHQ